MRAGYNWTHFSIMCSVHKDPELIRTKLKKKHWKHFWGLPSFPWLHSTPPGPIIIINTQKKRDEGREGNNKDKREGEGCGDVRAERLLLLSLHNCFIFPGGRQQRSLNPNTQSAHVFSQTAQWFHSSCTNPRTFLWYENTEEMRIFLHNLTKQHMESVSCDLFSNDSNN